jgi:hypothetical protein
MRAHAHGCGGDMRSAGCPNECIGKFCNSVENGSEEKELSENGLAIELIGCFFRCGQGNLGGAAPSAKGGDRDYVRIVCLLCPVDKL